MKKTVIIVALSIGFAAVLLNLGKTPSQWRVATPKTVIRKMTALIRSNSEGGTETKSQSPVRDVNTFAGMAESVEDLYYKVVRTPEEKSRWVEMISSPKNIDAATEKVRSYDASNLKQNERERMQAVLFLVRSLELEGNVNKAYIQSKVSELILDESVEGISNKDLKRSVIADRIELFVSAKEKYPALGQKIQNGAKSKLQKELILFANNFYDLDKKGEVK